MYLGLVIGYVSVTTIGRDAFTEWLENDTDLDSLRADPRFKALQQKL